VTVHVPVPVQAPPQPLKVEPDAGCGVSVTVTPLVKSNEHVAVQLIPAGALVTDPEPAPVFVTVSVLETSVNVAVTDRAPLIVTVHVPVPRQPAPLQPAKVEPAAGVAVSVTVVPWLNDDAQVTPQLIAAGALVTEPDPAPVFVTVSVCVITVNVAVTD
jgi:hypothetical protein